MRRRSPNGVTFWRIRFRQKQPDGKVVHRSVKLGQDDDLIGAVCLWLRECRQEYAEKKEVEARSQAEEAKHRKELAQIRDHYTLYGHSRRQRQEIKKTFDSNGKDLRKVLMLTYTIPNILPKKPGRPMRRMW